MQSSTNTLTVRVCSCDREGNMKLCNAEALTARAGLSTGALVAILLCVIILLSEYEACQCLIPLKSCRRSHVANGSSFPPLTTAAILADRWRSQLAEQNLDLACSRRVG